MIKASLIVATLGRYDELERLLSSLACQTIGSDSFEVVVVDQNDTIDLQPVIAAFAGRLTLHHIRSDVKGLSLNRNRGLARAQGEIVAFPDDDCTYYPDTLEKMLAHYDRHPQCVMVLGSIYDRSSNRPIVRRWPTHPVRVRKRNFFFLYSSVTIFSRLPTETFDERFGGGAAYGSYEDADYVHHLLTCGQINYDPSIQVWHPPLNAHVMPASKIEAYGLGFGAFVAKNLSFYACTLFLLSLGYHLAKAVKYAILFNMQRAKAHLLSASSRISGLTRFLRNEKSEVRAFAKNSRSQ
jgi:glycosyltransferase involved in cell wall biosynthesis